MLLIAVVVFLLTAAILIHRGQRRSREAVANLPGPLCPPLVGALHRVFKLNPKSFLSEAKKNLEKLGRLQRIWIFNRLQIVSSDVEFSEQVLANQEHLVKHTVYKLLGQWLGNGLLLSDGKVWHQRRKIITPAFHFSILDQFVEVFDQQSTICIKRLEQKADGKTIFDVYPFICMAALDIIAETAMGTKVNAQLAESTPYANAVNECTALMAWRFMSAYLQFELLFTLTHPHLKWRQIKLIRTMHEFTIKVIEQRRQALQEELEQKQQLDKDQDQDQVDNEVGSKRRMALLDVLLQAKVDGRPLSNDEIREEVDTFMFEGHDTTTSAISFCLWCISRHPDVQDKMQAEILHVLGTDRSRTITTRDLSELKYTECVMKESLRQFPPVPLLGRKLHSDFKYTHSKVGDGIIPAGAEILVAIIGMQNDALYFPEPELFKPERHENGERSSNFAYVPFSAGPRNCIGQKFAQLEMKMMLAKIVREFELLPMGDPVQPVVNIVLRSDNGFQMGMRRRNATGETK
ncbi:cytochrome P450 4d8 [Drosophila grimshawi]|uniref:GH16611 n=1 Tax=Drosophila grimshawi TaxID=7222 RepID=B4J287_DROGR|nr:cytochrome P450 4d8 [Drosophila grimshawi]EDV97038.1 GH16611 [Drosophila grimshawi]